jgi:hypothetical protein
MTVPRLLLLVPLLAASCAPGVAGRGGGSAPPPPAKPRFAVDVRPVTAASLGRSWHPGCPVAPSGLRLLSVSAWGFDGHPYRGRLVVNRDAVPAVSRAMRRLFALHYPIRRMRPVSAYGADDHRSMAADNTSAFNCRFVSGTTRWSQHAYGRAIDLNPLENPYVDGDHVSPPRGRRFADRSLHARGLVHDGGNVVRAFAAVGWGWGGHWSGARDYQHFSATGT